MDKKTIFFFSVIFLALFFVLASNLSGKPSTAAKDGNSASVITATEKLFDFGTISMSKGDVSHIFKVSNPTSQDVKIAKLGTSCMCTSAFIVNKDGSKRGPFGMPGMGFVPPADEVIKAGDSLEVEAVYNPNAHGPAGVGPVDRFVILTEESGATLQLEIKAKVTP